MESEAHDKTRGGDHDRKADVDREDDDFADVWRRHELQPEIPTAKKRKNPE